MNGEFLEGCAEEAYALSPLQEGMLFHSLYGRRPGVDIEQLLAELDEDLNVPAFQWAWRRVVERHPILRTGFHWENLEQPRQEVSRDVRLHWEFKDWRGLSRPEQKLRREAHLQADRRRGFNLTLAPLMRLALMRVDEAEYWLVWTFHHLLLDGRAVVVVLNDLFAFYEAQRAGYGLEMQEPPRYRDYIEWLQRQDWSGGEGFWRRALEGFTSPTLLAGGAAAGMGADTEPDSVSRQIQLSRALTTGLRTFAKEYDVTLNTLLQGAWALLLSRYSAQDDVAFGAIRACRHAEVPGVESMAGLVINTVPMRVRIQPRLRLPEWLRQIREHWVALRPYEHTPLLKVQEWSQAPRGQPLFETLLNVQDPSWDVALRMQGGRWTKRRLSVRSQPNYPLVLDVYGGIRLILKLWHDRRRFDDGVAAGMLEQLRQLLEAMVEDPQRTVAELSVLRAEERQRILYEWNRTEMNFRPDRPVLNQFEEHAARTPGAAAVADEQVQLTYGELNERANVVAGQLRALGVGPEQIVAVCLERSVGLAVGFLGVWKAGGAYLPMDASYPDERLQFMAEDAGVKVVLTQRSLQARWRTGKIAVVLLEDLLEPNAKQNEERFVHPGPAFRPESLAYVIYTSGSTGRPKGVEIPQGGLMNLVAWHQKTYGVSSRDRATQLAGPAYDACVWEFWPYLAAGASVHIAPEKTRLGAGELVRWLSRQRITVGFVPTPLAHAVLDEAWPKELSLRALLTGGEKLLRCPGRQFPCPLINHYGPTENSVVTTAAEIEPAAGKGTPIPIGRPIANAQVYVLDRNLEPVPVGVPGELYIGGRSLARGYRHEPELTAERFIPNPFSAELGTRLYKTGDVVRYLPNGEIDFLGRIDQQVKIRGHRVELGEIESILSQHPGVRDAAVLLHPNGKQPARLAAYVVPKPGEELAAPQLRDFLRSKLPDYMVPSAIVPLEEMPLTPNGKVNRKALPAPTNEVGPDKNLSLPRTPTEEGLAVVWEEVLGVKRVGLHDNFFDLGGHSMLATQVIARVYRLFQCELPVRDLFEYPTVSALAERIDLANRDAQALAPPPVLPREHGPERPLSYAQERLWFFEQLEPNQAFNNIPVAVRLEGRLNPIALAQSLTELARRHETLRTVFRSAGERPRALDGAEPNAPLPIVDLGLRPAAERAEELRRLADAEARRPFDLAAGPLWRSQLVRLAEEEHVLILNLHHTICDGWSLSVFFRELASAYECLARDQRPALPSLPIQYSDYAAWQREWLQGEPLDQQLAYWMQQLRGLPPALNLPTDHPRPAAQLYRGAKTSFAFPTTLSRALRLLSRREDVTQFMLLLAAFQTLLSRYSGQDDIVVGSPIAGRRRVETEGLIGFFANTVVLRGDLSGDPPFRELLRRVRRAALDAYAHQDLPFEKLVDGLQPERNLSHSPLFQVMFIFQRSPLQPLEMAGLRASPSVLDSGTSKFDLTLSLEESGEDLSGFIEYDTALFEPGTVTRILGHYQNLLEAIIAHPEQRLSRLPLLSASEKKQMLAEWNATRAEFPEPDFVHRMIERQVRRAPQAEAVGCGKHKLSYAELDAQAEALAATLRKVGVGPDKLVGVFMETSVATVVGLLAVLKAGGAYVPLDPAYPAERLAFMLGDAQPLAVLTQKKLRSHLPRYDGLVICLDGADPDRPDPAPPEARHRSRLEASPALRGPAVAPPLHPDHLAYVIYTSGSTGTPKGVCVTHRALTNFLRGIREKLTIGPEDVLLAVTTLSFDIAALEIYWPLVAGARTVFVTREEAMDGARLAGAISDLGATLMQATPATWRILLESGWTGQPSLTMLCGGESLPAALANALLERGAALWNLYGPTETTIWSAAQRVQRGDGPVPIGRPIANTQFYLLDSQGQLVPVGVPGELCIGGAGLARGYWNRPDLTAARFFPNPFSDQSGARLYRTGDRARFLADGTVEFLGRLDHQIKLRGYRIELGEIESVLAQHPLVREAIVVFRSDDSGRDRLVAYLTTHSHGRVSFEDLRRHLEAKLPVYMVPSIFVVLDALPLTPNGKIDRRALPVPSRSQTGLEPDFVPARTALEEVLATLWTKLFDLERVGARDNFFRLGGHSLLAVQLIARIRNTFKIELPLRALFEAPTIEELARVMIEREAAPGQLEKLAQLIKRVQGMSAKEVRKALRKTSTDKICTPLVSQS